MQRQQYLKKSHSQKRYIKCIICQIQKTSLPTVLLFPARILAQKYLYPPQQQKQALIISSFVNEDKLNKHRIKYENVKHFTKQVQVVTKYRRFNDTVSLIKPLILQRTNKDIINSIHFGCQTVYQYTLRRFQVKKKLKKFKPQFVKILPKGGSGTSTDQQIYTSPAKNKNKNPKPQANQPETIAVQRMARNLSNMLRKYQQNIEFHPSQIFDLIDSVPGHALDITQIQKQYKFKKELMENISTIEERQPTTKIKNLAIQRLQTQPTERLNTISEPMEVDTNHYGMKIRGNVASSRNLNTLGGQVIKKSSKSRVKFLKQNKSPNQRVQTEYDCCIIKKQKKRSINNKQLSKGISPSLKSLSKGRQKLKTYTSRSKLNKKY